MQKGVPVLRGYSVKWQMRFDFAKCKVKHTGERDPKHRHTQLSLIQKVYYGLACTNISLEITRHQK